jgi:hypothetical protein
VPNVKIGITPLQKIKRVLHINWNLKSIAGFAGPIPCIRKQNKQGRPVALIGRAPDSKSGCWGFESLLACHYQYFIGPGQYIK